MWQRFTERARKVVFFAQEEAGRCGENYVSTEHVLLGLVRENDSVAARVIDRLGFRPQDIRAKVEGMLAQGEGRLGQDMQLTPRAKSVIDLAYDEARQLHNNYIGTEHLLLGLIREEEGMAGQVFAEIGLTLQAARDEIRHLQEGGDGPRPASAPVQSQGHLLDTSAATLILRANKVAQDLKADRVGLEHYLLAIVEQEESKAARALKALGVDREAISKAFSELGEG